MAKKIQTLNLQIVVNIGNYETIRLGAEWTPSSTDMAKEMTEMDAELRAQAYNILMERTKQANPVKANAASSTPLPASDYAGAPKVEPKAEPKGEPKKGGKEPLHFDDKRVQQIVNRMQAQPSNAQNLLQQTLQYFEPDADVLKVLNAAAKLI